MAEGGKGGHLERGTAVEQQESMEGGMTRRTVGMAVAIVGALVLIGAVAADAIGIGNELGFGWKQTAGAAAGAVLLAAGAWLMKRTT